MSKLATLLKESNYTVIFTGAGFSTEIVLLHRNFKNIINSENAHYISI